MQQTFDTYLRSLRVLHLGLIIGTTLVFVVLNFIGESIPVDGTDATINYVAMVVVMVCLIAAFLWASPKMTEAKNAKDLNEKLVKYRGAFILTIALINGAAMICLVVHFFVHNDPNLLMLFALCWLALWSFFQIKRSIIEAIQPTGEEMALINDPNAIIVTIKPS